SKAFVLIFRIVIGRCKLLVWLYGSKGCGGIRVGTRIQRHHWNCINGVRVTAAGSATVVSPARRVGQRAAHQSSSAELDRPVRGVDGLLLASVGGSGGLRIAGAAAVCWLGMLLRILFLLATALGVGGGPICLLQGAAGTARAGVAKASQKTARGGGTQRPGR